MPGQSDTTRRWSPPGGKKTGIGYCVLGIGREVFADTPQPIPDTRFSMTPDRWQQIELVYHGALECEPHRRADYLSESCGGDEELRQEVESLLERDASSPDFLLNRPAIPESSIPASAIAGLEPGARVGAFEIEALLGAGGMGEVWKARDTRLG